MPDSAPISAIDFVQIVQLLCFAVLFVTLFLQDRANRSAGWFAALFVATLTGTLLHLAGTSLPPWLSVTVPLAAPIVGFGCLQSCLVEFTGSGRRTRWLTVFLVALPLPWLAVWAQNGLWDQVTALQEAVIGLQTAASACLLIAARVPERDALVPQRMMAAFLTLYTLVQWLHVAVLLHAFDLLSNGAAAQIGLAARGMYVVTLAVLPLTFLWMINRRLHARLERESHSDPLTGLCNRRGLEIAGQREMARYLRHGQGLAIVLVDIDHFKRLNDTLGHIGGDDILVGTASLLHKMLRECDTAGRFGGEEFVPLLTSIGPGAAKQAAERIRIAIEEHVFSTDGRPVRITASLGVTHSLGRTVLTWEKLLQEADIAMYTAKRDGRNCLRVFHEPSSESRSGMRTSVQRLRATS